MTYLLHRAAVRKVAVRRRRATFKGAVNHALRAGLGMESRQVSKAAFLAKPHSGGFMPGVDPHKLNKLAGDLEDEAVVAKTRRQ